ncbi:MAG TPA: L-threonylcarbamoyladenylate synthase [Steroidobacteraceae bacterium]|nr:L-threonylcarbamoyladenylate synthase [Steroidobacteraceae bacterium]
MVRATQTDIETAVEALRGGELVVFPTETVYGLGANAADPTAVRKIFEVKGRPPDHPVIVHLDDPRYLHRWVSKMPAVADQLAARFWPGPLTLILPKADNVNEIVTGGQDSIGIRVPSHPMAQQLLNAFGGGIAAPSANRYGRLSPTKPEHVRDELGDAVKVILDGGDSPIGLESTIVSCLDNQARLLRPGFITRTELERVVGPMAVGGFVPRTPGDRKLHYAPSTPLEIVDSDDLEVRAGEIVAREEKVAVLAMRPPLHTQRHMTWINAGKKPDTYAHNLYNHLRTLDRIGCVRIFAQSLPQDERWAAILDRLQRASGMGDDSLELSVG